MSNIKIKNLTPTDELLADDVLPIGRGDRTFGLSGEALTDIRDDAEAAAAAAAASASSATTSATTATTEAAAAAVSAAAALDAAEDAAEAAAGAGDITTAIFARASEIEVSIGEAGSVSLGEPIETLVAVADLPASEFTGGAANLVREQDDIVYDPGDANSARRYKLYFSVSFTLAYGVPFQTETRIFVIFSATGLTGSWSAPVRCKLMNPYLGSPTLDEQGQDPSVCTILQSRGEVKRIGGVMYLFTEIRVSGGPDLVACYQGTDGVNFERYPGPYAIPEASLPGSPTEEDGDAWDRQLVASPVARYDEDNSLFVVGYEGRKVVSPQYEAFGIVYGATPATLARHPDNPVWHPVHDPVIAGDSLIVDSFFLYPAADNADRYIFLAHTADGRGVYRGETNNVDYSTWVKDDPVLGGGEIRVRPGTGRYDLETFAPEGLGDVTVDNVSGMTQVLAYPYKSSIQKSLYLLPVRKTAKTIDLDATRIFDRIVHSVVIANSSSQEAFWNRQVPVDTYVFPGTSLDIDFFGDYLNNSGGASTLRVRVRPGSSVLSTPFMSIGASANRRKWFLLVRIEFEALDSQRVGAKLWMSQATTDTFALDDPALCFTGAALGTVDFSSPQNFELTAQHSVMSSNVEFRLLGGTARLSGRRE